MNHEYREVDLNIMMVTHCRVVVNVITNCVHLAHFCVILILLYAAVLYNSTFCDIFHVTHCMHVLVLLYHIQFVKDIRLRLVY